nr:cell division protein SepF [uncultured Catonella sp.]
MFKRISNFINLIKEGGEIEDDFEEDFEEDFEQEKIDSQRVKQNRRNDYTEDYEDYEEEAPSFLSRKKKDPKVIPIRKSLKSGQEVCVMTPKGFEEVEDVCDKLIAGSVVVLNTEAIEEAEAQRIIDFAFGTMHALNGKFKIVSKYVYIISPENIDLTPETEEELMGTVVSVPKVNGQ